MEGGMPQQVQSCVKCEFETGKREHGEKERLLFARNTKAMDIMISQQSTIFLFGSQCRK